MRIHCSKVPSIFAAIGAAKDQLPIHVVGADGGLEGDADFSGIYLAFAVGGVRNGGNFGFAINSA